VSLIGRDYVWFGCKEGFDDSGFLRCETEHWGQFKFNKKNGRFLRVFPFGYYYVIPGFVTDEMSDTPFIEIGVCSPF